MRRILVIASEQSLVEGLESAAGSGNRTFERAEDWSAGRERLVDEPFDAVCLDYESVKIEGLDSFVQLDNILQKEQTEAIVILREETPRAREFVEALDSFKGAVDVSQETASRFDALLEEVLEARPSDDDEPSGPVHVEVVLPDVSRGSFEEASLARTVHTLRRQEHSGTLTFSHGEMERRVEVSEGLLVATSSEIENLQAAFAWPSGAYSFSPGKPSSTEGVEPYAALLKGVRNHLDQRDAMTGLTPVMERYVSRTTFLENLDESVREDEALSEFIGRADGTTTLEEALSAIANRVLTGFQVGFFAIECDLVALTESPTTPPVEVSFSTPEISAERQASGGREGVAPDGRPAIDVPEEPTTEQREAELRRTHERFVDADPYEIFDLWRGCGEQEVSDRFYKLVKRHHPDSYGGNISGEAKRLAEEIFIRIKRAYGELQKVEDEQTVPPDEAVETDTSRTTLNQSLSSPSVTAMGSGQEDETEETNSEQGGPRRPAPEPSGGPGDRSAASSETPNQADGSESRGDEPGEENERVDKLKRLQKRLSEKDLSRSQKKTPFKPGVRQEKLASLRQNPEKKVASKLQKLDEPDSEDEAKEYFNAGYRAFKNEREAKSHRFFELAHEFDPDQPLWKTFYAYTLFLVDPDSRDRAAELLREVLDSEDRQARPDAHLFLGRLLKVQERHKQARRHFERAVELDPNSIEAQRELRVYKMREGDSSDPEDSDDSGSFFGNLLNKDLF